MEAASGRGIRFVALDAPEANLQTACGLRIRGPESTWVIYRPRPTPHQTEHVVLHVLAHEWLDHGTTVPLAEAIQPLPTALQHGVTEAFQGRLFTHTLGTEAWTNVRPRRPRTSSSNGSAGALNQGMTWSAGWRRLCRTLSRGAALDRKRSRR